MKKSSMMLRMFSIQTVLLLVKLLVSVWVFLWLELRVPKQLKCLTMPMKHSMRKSSGAVNFSGLGF